MLVLSGLVHVIESTVTDSAFLHVKVDDTVEEMACLPAGQLFKLSIPPLSLGRLHRAWANTKKTQGSLPQLSCSLGTRGAWAEVDLVQF